MKALFLDADWDPRPNYEPTAEERETKKATNSSNVWRNPELEIQKRDEPEPGPDEVLVKVEYAGVCGSDLSLIELMMMDIFTIRRTRVFQTLLGMSFQGQLSKVVQTRTCLSTEKQ
jgi:hypothetical protein